MCPLPNSQRVDLMLLISWNKMQPGVRGGAGAASGADRGKVPSPGTSNTSGVNPAGREAERVWGQTEGQTEKELETDRHKQKKMERDRHQKGEATRQRWRDVAQERDPRQTC